MHKIHPAYSLIPISIGILTIFFHTNTEVFKNHNPLWLGILSLCATFYILLTRYYNYYGNLLREFKEEHLDQLKAATTSSRFYKVEAAKGLMHITRNINNYTKIYNIRVRLKEDKPNDLIEVGKLWRPALEKLVREGKVEIEEIVANHKDFIEEAMGLLHISRHESGNNNYKCRRTIAKPKDLQIRNFMILVSNHPKGKGKRLELYWGWHSTGKSDARFLTYYTTDRAMVNDYLTRFNDMFAEAKEIQF